LFAAERSAGCRAGRLIDGWLEDCRGRLRLSLARGF
jgi:hypothetical protein